jgi:predicted TIM-barrel fold metal-dependent hydrolase
MRPYIDAHSHIGWTITRDPIVGQSTGRYMARMAASGVVAAIIGPTAVGSPQARGMLDTQEQNTVITRACQQFPDRFPIGLALIELRHERDGVTELERATNEGGLRGIMWHPSGGNVPMARLYPFLEVAAMGKGLCLLHSKATDTAALARRFPELTFLSFAGPEEAADLCAPLENIVFEVLQRPRGAGSEWDFARLVDRVGSERIVFGSDAPYYDWRVLQATLESADVSESIKDRIAYENAVSLIRRFVPDWSMPTQPVVPPQVYPPDELWAAKGERFIS